MELMHTSHHPLQNRAQRHVSEQTVNVMYAKVICVYLNEGALRSTLL